MKSSWQTIDPKVKEEFSAPTEIAINKTGLATLPTALFRLMGSPGSVRVTANPEKRVIALRPGLGHHVYSRGCSAQLCLAKAIAAAGGERGAGRHQVKWSERESLLTIEV